MGVGAMKRELVHGLTETIELKDWDFAIIQAALKLYVKDARRKGKISSLRYTQQLQGKLKRHFGALIKRTKREHRRIESLLTHENDLTTFLEVTS